MKRLFALVCALLLLSVPGFAHPGGTDGSGGHYNRSTGEYHFHHGYSAHQHPDGVCPYDFKDKTDHSAGSSNYSKPKSTPSIHKPGGNLWYTSSEHRNKALETPAPSSNERTDSVSTWDQIWLGVRDTIHTIGLFISCFSPLSTLLAGFSFGLVICYLVSHYYKSKIQSLNATHSIEYSQIEKQLLASLSVAKRDLSEVKEQYAQDIHKLNTVHRDLILDMKSREVRFLTSLKDANQYLPESTTFTDALQGFVEPDLSDGVVYISRDFSGRKYHYAWQCVQDEILISKALAVQVGYTACDCCTIADQPEHDVTVTISEHVHGVYHARGTWCIQRYTQKEIPLSKAQEMGLRPCRRCNPPTENPYVWF